MDGSVQSVLLFGFGNGTVDGSTGLVLTLGFGVPELAATLIGLWGDAIDCHGNADRINVHGNQDRIDVYGNQDRVRV